MQKHALSKEITEPASTTNRNVTYRITFNPEKATLDYGEPITLTDTLNPNLSLDYRSISVTTDPEDAERLILSLSKYMRQTLSYDSLSGITPLKKELELAKAEIERLKSSENA